MVFTYLMAVTIAVVSAGRLGDLFGHRYVMISGLTLFASASILCACAPNLTVLIVGRGLQGIGGAILVALPMSITRNLVPAERLGAAMGVLGTTSAAGTALGPSIGGLILTFGDWRMAFWLLAIFACVTLLLTLAAITPTSVQRKATLQELDLPGSVTLIIALAAYAFATNGQHTDNGLSPYILLAGSLFAFSIFFIAESRTSHPLVPITFLRDKSVGLGVAMNFSISAIMMSTLVIGPFFLAFSLELSETHIGLVLAVGPAIAALSGIPAGRITDRIGASHAMMFSLVQMVLALLCLAFLPLWLGVVGYIIALIVLTPSFQLFLAANNTAVLAGATKDQSGRLSGLLGLSRNVGLMTGSSVASSLFVTMLGSKNILDAVDKDIAHAFSMTFAVAAGLALLTLGLSLIKCSSRLCVSTETPT